MKKLTVILVLIISSINVFSYDTLSTKQVAPGIFYLKLADTTKPVLIDLLTIDLLDSTISIDVAVANNGLNMGGERTSDLIKRLMQNGATIFAGVNADFFGDYPMQAQNSIIINNEIIKAVNLKRTQIAFDNLNQPRIGRFPFEAKLNDSGFIINGINTNDTTLDARLFTHFWKGNIYKRDNFSYVKLSGDGTLNPNVNEILLVDRSFEMPDSIELGENFIIMEYKERIEFGDTLKVKFEFAGLSENVETMAGGLPSLFYDANIPSTYMNREGMKSKRFIGPNPRTAIGYNKNKSKLYIVTVDGRQPRFSMGFSLMELAQFMRNIGCYDALNFDGGGSTTMCIGDSVVNSPSDFTGERSVYNSLLIRNRVD